MDEYRCSTALFMAQRLDTVDAGNRGRRIESTSQAEYAGSYPAIGSTPTSGNQALSGVRPLPVPAGRGLFFVRSGLYAKSQFRELDTQLLAMAVRIPAPRRRSTN